MRALFAPAEFAANTGRKVTAGTVSNMYDILTTMLSATNSPTLWGSARRPAARRPRKGRVKRLCFEI